MPRAEVIIKQALSIPFGMQQVRVRDRRKQLGSLSIPFGMQHGRVTERHEVPRLSIPFGMQQLRFTFSANYSDISFNPFWDATKVLAYPKSPKY